MTIDGRVQDLADRIGRPVIVFDADFNVVAFSVHEGEVDTARLSIILSRKGSERAKALIKEHGADRAPGAVLIPVIGGAPPRVVAALRYQGQVTGYVSYVPDADERAEDRDAPAVQEARAELGAHLAARAAEERDGAERVARLTTRLLEGDAHQREMVADRLLKSGLISSSTVYSVMVFAVGDLESRDAAASRLIVERALSRISSIASRTSLRTVIDGTGVLIIPDEVSSQRLLDLINSLWFPGARGGGGSPRARLVDVHESRREAHIALRAAALDPQRYGPTAVWDDLGIDRLLAQLPVEQMTMKDLPDGIQHLLRVSSGADLAATLEAYLDNGADAQRTARTLHIHRSTLYYRLDRIREIVGADLSDGRVRRELHTALRVATLARLR
ncbi:helix-turn-helix domain-containing protein [Thermopolyspora sp. NPDC052614]|uniref:PucR family transcriptional regulator n=1 Tax=Thermopolyspora sp. NPDC052614 TaxID=3155682 RepID=UPI003429D9DF